MLRMIRESKADVLSIAMLHEMDQDDADGHWRVGKMKTGC